MRPVIFLLLLSHIFAFSAKGQYTYAPMPTDSAWWRCRQYIPESGGRYQAYDQLQYTTGEDTLMHGMLYKKIFLRHYTWPVPVVAGKPPVIPVIADAPDCFCGGMREAGKVVYFIGVKPQFNNCYSASDSVEYQYYNFNLAAGDSLNNGLSGSEVLIGQVISYIDTVLIGGTLRKRYHTIHETTSYPDMIIEGIGSIRGPQPWPSPYYVDNDLLCFTWHNEVLYSLDSSSCAVIYPYGTPPSVLSAGSIPVANDLSVYPNPFADIINVEASQGMSMTLYNSVGQQIRSCNLRSSGGKYELSGLSNLPAGIYCLVITDKNGGAVIRKMVRQ